MDTPNIHGYQIKNHICDTTTFQLFDALDPMGHSCVLKRLNDQDLSPQDLSNSSDLHWFSCNNHYYIIYNDQDYNREGKDYFNYNNDQPCSKKNTNNNLIFITPKKSSSFIKQYNKDNNSVESPNNTNNINNILSSNNKIKTPIPHHIIESNRIKSPMPNHIIGDNILPDSPYSNYSIESSDINNNNINNNNDDDDSDSDSNSDSDSDSDDLDVSQIDNNNCIITHENCNLKPILNINNNNNNNYNCNNNNSTTLQKKEFPCHIHIQTPTLLLNHPHHQQQQQHNKHIRRTPIPKDCWFNKDESLDLWGNPFVSNNNSSNNDTQEQEQHHFKLFQSWNDNENTPSDNKFELKIIQSSMLKRRSLPKCQFKT